MKLPNPHVFNTISEVGNILTSRQRLKQFMTLPLYANAIYLMATTVILSLLGFAFWTVVTRFYTEVDVGFASAAISALSLITMLSLVGLDLSIIRFLPQEKKPQELINSYFTFIAIISVVTVGIFTAGLDLWSPSLSFIKGNAVFCVVFIATAIMGALSRLIDNVFIAKRKAGFTLLKNIIFSVLKIPLPILFTLFFHSFGIIASWGISIGISVAVSLLFFMPRVQNHYKLVPTLNLNLIRGIWRYSGGNYLASLLTAAPATVLPMMVVNILGPVQNAYFYIAWMVATLLFTIPLSVSQSLFAEGSYFEDKLRENVIKSAKFTFLLLVPAVILVILVGKWVLLAFGQSYSENALHLLRILAVSSLPLSVTFIYSTVLRVTARIKELIIIWAFSAVTTLVVSYLIMPVTGIISIGYAWLGVQGALAIYILIIRRLYRS